MDRISIPTLQKKKKLKDPIVALTCFDAASAKMIDPFVDISLVGDSLANTRLGYESTLPITFDEMLHHVKAAARGNQRSFLVADMPFQSYEYAPWEAAKAAGKMIKQGGAKAVKLEGGKRIGKSITAIINANIPVMGHLGLVPQSVNHMGGYRVQGKTAKQARTIYKDALFLQNLGVFALVLEGIPASLAKKITRKLKIPTIGIGAGPNCDGQILVLDDILGFSNSPPRFVKEYASLRNQSRKAIMAYQKDVESGSFPTKKYSY